MEMNTLGPVAGSKKKRNRVGRGEGSGNGKTCGRGVKGQKSRSGGFTKVGFEGGQMPLQRRLPKRGFASRKAGFAAELRLDTIAKVDGDSIDLLTLKAQDFVPHHIKTVKVVATGEISRAVNLKGLKVTAGAVKAIEAAGGSVEA